METAKEMNHSVKFLHKNSRDIRVLRVISHDDIIERVQPSEGRIGTETMFARAEHPLMSK